MQAAQEAYDNLKNENMQLQEKINEQAAKIKTLKGSVHHYQQTYHDIDIGELHRKLQFLESENDVMTRLNTQLTQHVKVLIKNHDTLRTKLKVFKDREKRDKDAAEAA